MDTLLSQLSAAVPGAESTEQLTRPLLEILSAVAGMESTYLTTIDLEAGLQHVRIARNVGPMQIPEGIEVPWDDTLCKRSLEEGRMYTPDVADCWPDSAAAKALGIRTYVSTPVRGQRGTLLGTLCAASAEPRPLTTDTEKLLKLFSQMIGAWLEREQLLVKLGEMNSLLASYALVDVLTGLPNRRAITDMLERALAQAKREGKGMLVGLIDLDHFKQINDTHGHQIGDLFLQEIGRRLRTALRTMDSVGRLGGDEFGVVAPPGPQGDRAAGAQRLADRLTAATIGTYKLKDVELDYAGASVGVVVISPGEAEPDEAFRLADAQMYLIKRQRRLT